MWHADIKTETRELTILALLSFQNVLLKQRYSSSLQVLSGTLMWDSLQQCVRMWRSGETTGENPASSLTVWEKVVGEEDWKPITTWASCGEQHENKPGSANRAEERLCKGHVKAQLPPLGRPLLSLQMVPLLIYFHDPPHIVTHSLPLLPATHPVVQLNWWTGCFWF